MQSGDSTTPREPYAELPADLLAALRDPDLKLDESGVYERVVEWVRASDGYERTHPAEHDLFVKLSRENKLLREEIRVLRAAPFLVRAADRLYDECERAIRDHRIDARSPIGDATLDYREIREEAGERAERRG